MAQGSNEGGVLPTRAVPGASEAVNAAVWPPLHLNAAFELFQSFERDLDRMPVEPAGLGMVVRGAGWQVPHCYGKPFEQPFSQRPHPEVQREPVQNAFLYGVRLQHCHDALIVAGSPTLKTHPQDPPTWVGRKRNGKRGGFASPSGAESRRR